MGFIHGRVACKLFTVGDRVEVNEEAISGSKAEEESRRGMIIQFARAKSWVLGGDQAAKHSEVSEIGATACPCFKGCTFHTGVERAVVEINRVDEGVGPEFRSQVG